MRFQSWLVLLLVACSLAQTGLSILMGRVTTNLRTELNVCREVVAKQGIKNAK
jgi:hypothetical protein